LALVIAKQCESRKSLRTFWTFSEPVWRIDERWNAPQEQAQAPRDEPKIRPAAPHRDVSRLFAQ
jgi:hypothetical protein